MPLIHEDDNMEKSQTKTVIQEILSEKKYFSTQAVKRRLRKAMKTRLASTSVNQYLYNLKRQGQLFDAGRGWYSTVSQTSSLPMEPVQKLITDIKKRFPFLEFSVWSTEQLKSLAHHIMSRFTIVLYTDTDSMPSVGEFLKDSGYKVFVNPKKDEVAKYFEPSANTVVIRQSVSEEPTENSSATFEKLMVDLFLEKDRLNLMDGSEFVRIFRNLILSQRINLARLLRYAYRRKVRKAIFDEVLREQDDIILF